MLEQEVASEPEALVIAFKTDGRVFLVQEFTVAQKIERGRVSLEKQAVSRTTSFYHQRKLSRRRPRLAWECAFEAG